jgi:hypothetical protein
VKWSHRLTFSSPPVKLKQQPMRSPDTPLFATSCLGATIAHVHVFATHILYEQKFGRDITVAADMIASVEKSIYEHGFLILWTTSRRRIISTLHRKHTDRLCRAILRCMAHKTSDVIAPVSSGDVLASSSSI